MKTSLEHLPTGKRAELAYIVEVLREGFAFATSRRTQPHLRAAKLLKIILFGSYARGDWVEDPIGRYFSDFDLLVVVNHENLTDVSEFWEKTEQRLIDEVSVGNRLRTLASPIFHSFDDVNKKLQLGKYFFIDILKDGVILFEEPGYDFVDPRPLSPQRALQEAQDYYEEWCESAERFFVNAQENTKRGWNKEAAFLFHQSVERFYHCLFLVITLYSPKTHNLNRLRAMAEELDPLLRNVWQRDSRFQKRCYSLLREAYVKARYSRSFKITTEELEWIAARVGILRDLVKANCQDRIVSLRFCLEK